MAGRQEEKVVNRAKDGVRDLPRSAASLLSRVLRPNGSSSSADTDVADKVLDKGRQVIHRAASAVGSAGSDRGVEALLRRAEEAAEAADAAEAEAMERAEEAKRTAEEAQHVADEAKDRLAEAEAEAKHSIESQIDAATRDGEELVRQARRQATEHVDEVRVAATRDAESELDDLKSELDAEVASTRGRAQEAAARAQAALVAADDAVAQARELATQARQTAEDAAAEAVRTADRLGWEERDITATPTVSKKVLAAQTKAELLDLATTAHVEGRSHMTKAQLVNALAGAGKSS